MGKRNRRFIISLSREEKRQLAELAESEGGLSQAAVLRWLLHRELTRKGLKAAIGQDHEERTDMKAGSSRGVEDE